MDSNTIEASDILDGFVTGIGPAIRTIESIITEIAPTNIPVLLIGESGTGKEIFARRVHSLSHRRREPLSRIACASMNAGNFCAELGLAASGAKIRERPLGTVLFDEISELDSACQRTLLYALPEDQEETRAGLIPARVISTSRCNLEEEMKKGHFRRELYYRVNGICLRLPPLRERTEDIPVLVEMLLTKHAARLNRPRPLLSGQALRRLAEHKWPGNIRELEAMVKKIVAVGDERLALVDLDVEGRETGWREPGEAHDFSLKEAARAASREAERQLIMKALTRTQWNRKRAARQLQVSYKSFLYKLKQIGLESSEAQSMERRNKCSKDYSCP